MIVKRIISRLKRALAPEPPSLLFGELDRYTDLISDEYVEHLRSVIGGWAVEGNIRAFECCIRNMPSNGAIVEIGSFLGLSTNIIAYAAWKYKRQKHLLYLRSLEICRIRQAQGRIFQYWIQ